MLERGEVARPQRRKMSSGTFLRVSFSQRDRNSTKREASKRQGLGELEVFTHSLLSEEDGQAAA